MKILRIERSFVKCGFLFCFLVVILFLSTVKPWISKQKVSSKQVEIKDPCPSSSRSHILDATYETPQFSIHHCLGGAANYAMVHWERKYIAESKLRSCEFNNVCLENGKFKYFTSTNDVERVQFGYSERGGNIFGKADFVLPSPLVGVASRYRSRIGKLEMIQCCGSPPDDAVWIDHPVLTMKRSAGSNFGHMLRENVLPAYMLMTGFGEDGEWISEDVQFLFLDDCYDDKSDHEAAFLEGKKYQDNCARMTKELFGFMSGRKLLFKNDIKETVCFKRLLAGTEPFTMMMGPVSMYDGNDGGRGLFFRKWRDFTLRRMKFPKLRRVSKDVLRITVSEKSGTSFNSRDFVNMNESIGFLKEQYSQFNGLRIEIRVLIPGKTSFQEEIEVLSDTDLWIVPGGATHISGMFLPKGSTLLTFPLCSRFEEPQNSCQGYLSQLRQENTVGRKCVCRDRICCFVDDQWFHNFIPCNVVIYEVKVPDDITKSCRCFGSLMRCEDCGIIVDFKKLKTAVDRALVYSLVYRQTHEKWAIQLF